MNRESRWSEPWLAQVIADQTKLNISKQDFTEITDLIGKRAASHTEVYEKLAYAEDRWGSKAGYLKTCQVECPWPSIPRRMIEGGKADEITCDVKKDKWTYEDGPQGCDEPYGRGYQCIPPYTDPHGNWECSGQVTKPLNFRKPNFFNSNRLLTLVQALMQDMFINRHYKSHSQNILFIQDMTMILSEMGLIFPKNRKSRNTITTITDREQIIFTVMVTMATATMVMDMVTTATDMVMGTMVMVMEFIAEIPKMKQNLREVSDIIMVTSSKKYEHINRQISKIFNRYLHNYYAQFQEEL